MEGYFLSFLVTHLINFLLSLRRLLIISGETIPLHIPLLALCGTVAAVWGARQLSSVSAQCIIFLLLLSCLFTLMQICGKEDYLWFARLVTVRNRKKHSLPDTP